MSNKGSWPLPRRACPRARLTSTWTLTLTAIVEVDVAVDVEPIVDLDVGPRRQIIFVSMATTLVSSSTPRSYRCGLIVCWSLITSRIAAHSIAEPRAIV